MTNPARSESDLYVDWNEYHRSIEQLCLLIYESNWHFDSLLCLARGGLRVGDVISVGRSVLLFGTRDQIAHRLEELRTDGISETLTTLKEFNRETHVTEGDLSVELADSP